MSRAKNNRKVNDAQKANMSGDINPYRRRHLAEKGMSKYFFCHHPRVLLTNQGERK
jgi:hypothetical protein